MLERGVARGCVLGLGLWALLGAAGCDFRGSGGEPEVRDAQRGLREGREVFRYSFDQEALDPALWNNTGGEAWKVVDGTLQGREVRNRALWLKQPLPERVRVEFDARSESPEGDLKAEIFGDGKHHESGYVVIFGGWKNSINCIARLDEHGKDRKVGQEGVKVEPGRTYRIAIVRTDEEVRWFVDGAPFMTYTDASPLVGEAHRYFAFNDWSVPVYFDNLVVYELP